MGRYEKIKKNVKEELAFKKEQQRLHEKHDAVDPDAVIIEKSNMGKFILTFLSTALRTIFGIITIILATIGILTLIYPETRTSFFEVINQIIKDVMRLIK